MAGIRLRHLLHHTSGLADVTAPSRGLPASNAEVLERLQRHPPPALDSPGRRFSYNNTGYVLLAEVVSRVFQRPIGPLAREQIFRPLAMTRTSLSAVAPTSSTEPRPRAAWMTARHWTTPGESESTHHRLAAASPTEAPGRAGSPRQSACPNVRSPSRCSASAARRVPAGNLAPTWRTTSLSVNEGSACVRLAGG